MRVSISNIAWEVGEDEAVAHLLSQYGVDAIDVAPGKYFPVPSNACELDIAKVKQWWSDRGIEITGMQALLFGTNGLNVFGTREVQEALLAHLDAVCRIGARLGAARLVFGSPKNRDRSGLTDKQAYSVATTFFGKLGDIAQRHNVIMCLEPNPVCYGSNFMTTSAEAADVVKCVGHPAIKMQLDTGALTINGESIETVLSSNAELVGHIHLSEPNLLPLGDCGTTHQEFSDAIRKYLPKNVVTVEMLATKEESHLGSIDRAMSAAVKYYRQEKGIRL